MNAKRTSLLCSVCLVAATACDPPGARNATEVLLEKPRVKTACPLPERTPATLPFPNPDTVNTGIEHIDTETCKVTRTGMKRLNRTEIELSMAQLLDVDPGYANELPGENSEAGFDNIGSSLPVTASLLEKLNAASETLIQRALRRTDVDTTVQVFEAENLEAESGNATPVFYRLNAHGQLRMRASVEREGRYEIRIRAFGEQAGNEPVRMSLLHEGAPIASYTVEATFDAPVVYRTSLRLAPREGEDVDGQTQEFSIAFLNDWRTIDRPADQGGDRNLVVDYIEIEGPFLDAQDLDGVESPASRTALLTCAPSDPANPGSDDETPLGINGCARQILRPFVERAWRRAPTDAEMVRLLSLVDHTRARNDNTTSSELDTVAFEEGIQLALRAVMLSPHFLFRMESSVKGDGAQLLRDDELAERLAFFLWSQGPDERLLRIASHGWLQDDAILEQEVRRMLTDDKARALVDNFAGQWLQSRAVPGANPDPNTFPDWSMALAQDFKCETENLFADVLFSSRSVYDLVDTRETFASRSLARFYDLPNAESLDGSYQRVSLEGTERRGLLTHGSFLTVTSNPTRTSLVKRGVWVLDNLMCTPPPPPPPGVEGLNEEVDPNLSFAERIAAHRDNPSCRGCHEMMDPIGMGLENFDGIGQWRDRDGNVPIEPNDDFFGTDPFEGHNGLIDIIRAREEVPRCVTEKLLTYSLGRALGHSDHCFIDAITEATAEGGHKLDDIVVQVVLSPAFRMTEGIPTDLGLDDTDVPATSDE